MATFLWGLSRITLFAEGVIHIEVLKRHFNFEAKWTNVSQAKCGGKSIEFDHNLMRSLSLTLSEVSEGDFYITPLSFLIVS